MIAPTNPSANQPLRMAAMMCFMASTNVRSLALASPGMTDIE